jgi:hypothetical protein
VLAVQPRGGVDAIESSPTGPQDRPLDPPTIEGIELDPE